MKITNKLISFFTVLAILCQFMLFAPADALAAKREVNTAGDLKFLNAIGIVEEVYEDITLGEKITRLDFALAVAGIFGNRADSSEAEPQCRYNDMTGMGAEAIKAVNLLTDLGIISGTGDGSFRPYDDISYEQAVKMLVCALGYEFLALEAGGYPLGYFAQGATLGLTDGIALKNTDALTWQHFITLISNSLFVDIMESKSYGEDVELTIANGDTLLNTVMKIYSIEDAKITANSVTTVGGGEGVGYGVVEINRLRFQDPRGIADSFIGKEADVYYTEDKSGKKTLLYINADYEILNLSIDDITSIDGYRLTYYDDESNRDVTVSIATDAVMLYNGQALYWTPSMIDLESDGEITLERSGSSAYDVVTVDVCINILVAAVDYTECIVYDKLSSGSPEDLSGYEADKRLVVYKNGEKTDIHGIETGSLISLYKSPDNSFMTVKVTDSKITGAISAYTDQMVVIDGNEYKYSSSLGADFAGRLGSVCTAYLNEYGKIIWFTVSASDTLRYGYVIDGGEETGMEKALYLRILSQDNKIEELKIADKIKLNNVFESDAISAVKAEMLVSSAYKQQLIQYALNADGEIRLINTCKTSGIISDRYRYEGLCEFMSKGDYNYRSTRYSFSGRATIDANTKVFIVSPSGSKQAEDFSLSSMSFFVGDRSYTVAAYNVDNGGKADVLVCWEALNSFSSVSIGGRVMMVDYITTTQNADGDIVQKVYGLSGGKYVSYVTDTDTELKTNIGTPRPLKRGDIVNLSYNRDGSVCFVKTLVDIDNQPTTNYSYSTNNAWKDNWAISGAFYSMEGNNAIISKTNVSDLDTIFETPNFENLYAVTLPAAIMIYDENTDSVYLGTAGDILTYKTSGADASRFFVRFYKDNLNTVFIFKR